MKSKKLLEYINGKQVVIPSILLMNYKDLKINEKELIFMSYLLSKGEYIVFDITKICKDLNMLSEEAMELVSSLSEKHLLHLTPKKDEQNLMKDYLDISHFSQKLLSYVIDNSEEELDQSNVYETIEKEFGRPLSPIEYETIKGWLDTNINEELIYEALKEAVLNGVNNLKYIDKILFEWGKKGYKNKKDLNKKKVSEEIIEVFDYDWLKDNE